MQIKNLTTLMFDLETNHDLFFTRQDLLYYKKVFAKTMENENIFTHEHFPRQTIINPQYYDSFKNFIIENYSNNSKNWKKSRFYNSKEVYERI